MLNILYFLIFQTPTSTPNPGENSAIDFSKPFDIIVFVILPIVVVFLYFLWRRKQKEDKNQ